jgi:hypothetical protein
MTLWGTCHYRNAFSEPMHLLSPSCEGTMGSPRMCLATQRWLGSAGPGCPMGQRVQRSKRSTKRDEAWESRGLDPASGAGRTGKFRNPVRNRPLFSESLVTMPLSIPGITHASSLFVLPASVQRSLWFS